MRVRGEAEKRKEKKWGTKMEKEKYGGWPMWEFGERIKKKNGRGEKKMEMAGLGVGSYREGVNGGGRRKKMGAGRVWVRGEGKSTRKVGEEKEKKRRKKIKK